MKKKVIFVAYARGRCGTSALMGILEKMNIYTGKSFRDERNPKGYFEDPEYFDLIKKELPFFINRELLQNPSDTTEAISTIRKKSSLFKKYLEKITEENDIVALKSPGFFGVIIADILKTEYDFYIIKTSRNIDDQINSTLRMWNKSSSVQNQSFEREKIRKLIENWIMFGDNLISKFPENKYFNTSFEELINNKFRSVKKIANFLNIPPPEDSVIEGWIDERLVNRNVLSASFLTKLKIQIHNFYTKLILSFKK